MLSQVMAAVERELLEPRSKAQEDLKKSLERGKQQQQEIDELRRGKEAAEARLKDAEAKLKDAEAKLRDAASDISHLSGQLKKYGTPEVHLGIARNSAWKTLRSRGLFGVVKEMSQLAGNAYVDARVPPLLEDLLPADYEGRSKLIGEYSFPEAGKEMEYRWYRAMQSGGFLLSFSNILRGAPSPSPERRWASSLQEIMRTGIRFPLSRRASKSSMLRNQVWSLEMLMGLGPRFRSPRRLRDLLWSLPLRSSLA